MTREDNMGKYAIALIAALALTGPAAAEQVTVPVGSQAPAKQGMEKPRRGISKEKVREKFGEPVSTSPAVGDPPISAWEYPEYFVYFEYDLVLHTVLKPETERTGARTME